MDWMYMHMPVAGVDIFWPGLLLIGFSVGVIGGFFGMGGAWMVTPGLNILGFPMAFAIGTDIAHIAGKSMISTMRHSKFGNVDYKLGFVMLVGTMFGIEIGAQIVMALERIGQVGPVVRWVYVLFLPLICGARVTIASRETAIDGVRMKSALMISSIEERMRRVR